MTLTSVTEIRQKNEDFLRIPMIIDFKVNFFKTSRLRLFEILKFSPHQLVSGTLQSGINLGLQQYQFHAISRVITTLSGCKYTKKHDIML